MGLLSSPPNGAEADDVPVDDGPEEAPEQQPDMGEPAPPPEKAVPLPDKALSRRETARRDRELLEKKVGGLEETLTKMTEETRRERAEYQAQMARMMGNFEAMQRQPQQAPQVKQPDPTALMEEATAHLEKGEFSKYQAKLLEAAELRAINKMRTEYQPQQQQAQPAMDPRMQGVIMSTPAAGKVLAHERGMQMAQVKDNELAVMGVPNGPDRWRKAFELAEQTLLGNQPQRSQFPASGKQALAGIPTSRINGSSKAAGPQVKPPANWEMWARRSGMTKEEYLNIHAATHPESVSDE